MQWVHWAVEEAAEGEHVVEHAYEIYLPTVGRKCTRHGGRGIEAESV